MTGWRRVNLRRLATLGTGHTPSRQKSEYWVDCTIPWLTLADVWQLRDGHRKVVSETSEKISELGLANSSAVLHPAGTVAMSRTASVGFSCILNVDMATSQDYVTWTCGPNLKPRFLLYAIRGLQNDILGMRMGSTHQTIYMSDIERIAVPVPPISIQDQITDFLDAETSRIDALVAKKYRTIELMNERTLSNIYAAIRGENEIGDRKNSGLRWLDSIPKVWPIMPVGSQFEVLLGKMLDERRMTRESPRKYLRNVNVQWDYIKTEDLAVMDFMPHERGRFGVLPGDLLVCEGGEPGRAAIWHGDIEEIYYQKALHRCRPTGHSIPRWLFYCLRAATSLNVFTAEGNSTTIAHLTSEQLRSHRLPFPDQDTQYRLVSILDEAGRHDQEVVGAIEQQILLLKERKQALLTAAVIGELAIPGVIQ